MLPVIQEECSASLGDLFGKGVFKILIYNFHILVIFQCSGTATAMNLTLSYIPIYCSRNYLSIWVQENNSILNCYLPCERFNNLLAWFNGARLLLERSRAGSSVICTFSSCLCIKSDGSGTLEMAMQAKAEGAPTGAPVPEGSAWCFQADALEGLSIYPS